MKKINSFLLLIFTLFCIVGFGKKTKPFIVFDKYPIKSISQNINNVFKAEESIYYAIYTPKGFKDDTLRIQVIKKENSSHIGTGKIHYTKDVSVKYGEKLYLDRYYFHNKGTYFIRIFEFRDFETPIIEQAILIEE